MAKPPGKLPLPKELADNPIFMRLLIEVLGGRETLEMMALHYVDGASYRDLANRFEISRGTIHKRLARARGTLTRHGLWPAEWEGLR